MGGWASPPNADGEQVEMWVGMDETYEPWSTWYVRHPDGQMEPVDRSELRFVTDEDGNLVGWERIQPAAA